MTDSKREQTVEELVQNIIAIFMCELNQPLWETRLKVENELLAYARDVERRTAERMLELFDQAKWQFQSDISKQVQEAAREFASREFNLEKP